jgi:hypothetical protein
MGRLNGKPEAHKPGDFGILRLYKGRRRMNFTGENNLFPRAPWYEPEESRFSVRFKIGILPKPVGGFCPCPKASDIRASAVFMQ